MDLPEPVLSTEERLELLAKVKASRTPVSVQNKAISETVEKPKETVDGADKPWDVMIQENLQKRLEEGQKIDENKQKIREELSKNNDWSILEGIGF